MSDKIDPTSKENIQQRNHKHHHHHNHHHHHSHDNPKPDISDPKVFI